METKRKKFGMEMWASLHKRFKANAILSGLKLYEATEQALEAYLEKSDPKNKTADEALSSASASSGREPSRTAGVALAPERSTWTSKAAGGASDAMPVSGRPSGRR